MITVIRSKIMGTHAYIMWAIVIVLILSLGAPGVMRQGSANGPWVLKINDQEIGYNAFARTVQTQEQLARQKYGSLANMITPKELYSQALDLLIYSELLDQIAKKTGISIAPCYVAARMSDPRFIIPVLAHLQALQAYSWHTGIDMRALRKILFDKGMTIEDFENEVAKTLSQELIQQAVFIAGYSPEFEQMAEYKATKLGKTMSLVSFPLSHFVALEQEAGATKKELQAFFDLHKAKYSEPEKRSALVWEFTPANFGSVITPQQVEAYYAKHKETAFVQDPVKIQVRRILLAADDMSGAQALKKELDANPAIFADKARALSIDKASSANGGLLQPFARGSHDKEFDKKAFLLAGPGTISDIITTKDGLEIIQLVERTNKTYKPLKAVTKEISDQLSLKQFNDAFDIESKRIVRQQDTKALQTFIGEHNGVQTAYNGVTRQSSPMAQRFFGLSVDAPITFVEDNKGYIAVVTTIQPSATPALSTVESRVTKDLLEQRAEKKLASFLQGIQKKAQGDLQALANQYKGSVTRLENIKPGDADTIDAYKNKGIAIEKILQMEKPGAVAVMQTPTHGYLARLEKVEKIDLKAFDEAKAALAASLRQERMQLTLMGFIASARRNATIKQNDALITMRGQ